MHGRSQDFPGVTLHHSPPNPLSSPLQNINLKSRLMPRGRAYQAPWDPLPTPLPWRDNEKILFKTLLKNIPEIGTVRYETWNRRIPNSGILESDLIIIILIF